MLICQSESMNKYSTKRTSSNSFDSYNKHRRDYSPNRRSHSRNSSPDGWSPRGSSSYSKSYSRRSKDRDRDSKYYDGCSKSKYMRSRSRSPVGHETSKSAYKSTSSYSRDPYYENNHHSSSSYTSVKKSHFGDWTEQISSSGKRYFYNSKTEVSQWDKPKDWADWEKRHSTSNSKYSNSSSADKYATNNYRDKYDTNSNSKSYAYSNDSYSSREREKSKDVYGTRHGSSPNYRSHNSKTRESEKRTHNDAKKSKTDGSNDYSYKNSDLTSPLKSTDSHCILNNNNHSSNSEKLESPKRHHHHNNNNLDKATDYVNNVSSAGLQLDSNSTSSLVSTLASLVSAGQPSLNLSKIFSQLKNSQGINLSSSSQLNEEALLLLKKALNLTQKSHHSTNNNQTHHQNSKVVQNSPRNSTSTTHQSTCSPSNQSKHHSNANKSHSIALNRHLNSAEGIKQQDLDLLTKSLIQSPTSSAPDSKNALSNNRNENVTSGLSTISSAISSSVSQKNPLIDLSRYKHLYREDLTGHVVGWYAEQLEKQANSYGEQSIHIGNHLCTRVSSELKNARSLVRLKEIQATLQKQRNFFEIQQIKSAEDWKAKQFPNLS